MTPVSGVLKRRIRSCSTATSASFSAAVGSSMMSTFASWDRALAISTVCCFATVSFPTSARGSRASCRRSMSSPAARLSARSLVKMPPRRGSRPM